MRYVEDDFEELKEYVLDEALRRVKQRTPVDEGTARDSFFVGNDDIVTDDIIEKILALEYGHSDQAPQGMLRRTVAEVPQIIEEYLRRTKQL